MRNKSVQIYIFGHTSVHIVYIANCQQHAIYRAVISRIARCGNLATKCERIRDECTYMKIGVSYKLPIKNVRLRDHGKSVFEVNHEGVQLEYLD